MNRKWLVIIGLLLVTGLGTLYYVTQRVHSEWEPLARQRLIEYLEQRFDSSVEIGKLDFRHREGTRATALARKVTMRYQRRTDIAPIFTLDELHVSADLNVLYNGERTIELVELKGLRITLPPRGQRPSSAAPGPTPFLVKKIIADGSSLVILPSKPGKAPLEFEMAKLTLAAVAPGQPLHYDTVLNIPKPPGRVTAQGSFGPWNTADPRRTQLSGVYDYREADLGVFKGIAGTLASTGKFEGALEEIRAQGECRVPDFRLSASGNPMPLNVDYTALVDGADGDTYVRQAKAKLGSTSFDVQGHVIGTAGQPGRAIHMAAQMPKGNLADLLRLAVKGHNQFLTGSIRLNAVIDVPRGDVNVVDKMSMHGRFEVREANFTSQTIQDKIDSLSQRGRGRPKDASIDNVPATFNGQFTMADAVLAFKPAIFVVPGALVDLNGNYQINAGQLDFHGSLNLSAAMSNTFAGWKRWALKPFNPIFSKNEVGTYLPIQITGNKDNPHFGLDRKKN